ncbi:acyltransferase [Streptomyces sp. DSM 44917]|uniref:Acyltransferase n=1 Tax=Streptomyces boetiae TaxID=3075541 RepID=A0ABU2L757_9ACTN|nr:acyltransferase [Streptomyces sp. DSM 44917]MDT0307138.1 acyltransferase [Streptomyces sp. DSM 44917]
MSPETAPPAATPPPGTAPASGAAGPESAGAPAVPEPAPASAPRGAPPPTDGDLLTPLPVPRSAPEHERRYDVDLLRLLASCAVIVSHVSASFIAAVDRREENGPSAYWIGHIGDAALAFAVPVFFAIAGWAVLMGAPPRDSSRMWQRVVRNGTPLFVWTGAYLAWAWLRDRNDAPMTDLAVDGIFGSVQPAYHLWFMYAYIPIVMALGFVVLMRGNQRPWSLGVALLVLAGLPHLLATAGEITGWNPPPVGWGFGTYSVIYAIGGALVLAHPRRMPPLVLRLAGPVFVLSVAGIVWWDTQVHYVIPNAHPFVALSTLSLLVLVARVRVPERWRPALARYANAAMGAYMVHILFVEELVTRAISEDAGAFVTLGTLLSMGALTVVLAYAASLAWGKLGLRRWLG